ncbi:addiction module toxin, HicA family [Clostridium sp. MCC353]|uniref:type II toxin-antitoxin system HicA family toxin n=1 Tax=Clostridium sp. MCC353 TaxID=2592646 RepID=UPI001C0169B5|nr:type II toxin-antitoxin system HicA family toxin [Clostridium sp. MCC353]MBT9779165.1 addiction module toxin, HicA family [Clostridium sp. MCC353]
MNTNFRKIEKTIVADGWALDRINGSHYLYKKEGFSPIVIPNHKGRDLSIGVTKNLESITGLSLRR